MNSKIFLSLSFLVVGALGAMDNNQHTAEIESQVANVLFSMNLEKFERLEIPASIINKAFVTLQTVSGQMARVTPVVYAVCKQSKELLALVLKKKGVNPLGLALGQEEFGTALQEAAKRNNSEIIKQIKDAVFEIEEKAICDQEQMNAFSAQMRDTSEAMGYEEKFVNLSDVYQLKVAITANDLQAIPKLAQKALQTGVSINKVLVPLTLVAGKIVQVSPLLFAVHTQNIPLVKVLLYECHALIYGKYDKVKELGSALQEAYKSNNDDLKKLVREYAWLSSKAGMEGKIAVLEHMISPQASDGDRIAIDVAGGSVEDIRRYEDYLQLMNTYSEEEIDKFLLLQDKIMTEQFCDFVISQFDHLAQEIQARLIIANASSGKSY